MVEINTLTRVTNKIKGLLNSGHERSIKARKNILISFFIKGVSIIIGFIFVPLLINYLGTAEYGIWITMSSVIAWIGYFDIGLGNGLRNRFAESLAKGEYELAQIYVSTTYAGLIILFGLFFMVFLGISPLIDWSRVLNAPPSLARELHMLINITVGFFVIRFILKLLSVVIVADQRPAVANTFEPAASILSLIGVLFLMYFSEPSLLNLGIVLGVSPVIIFILASIYFYNKDYKRYRPVIKKVKFKYFKNLAGLGFQFFIIQITIVVIMSANNIIITQIVGPEAVTSYNVAYRYFGLITMAFAIIANTYWSAYTEAYIKGDISWIRKTTSALIKIWFGITITIVIMLLSSNIFYQFWVGEKVKVPFLLSLFSALFVIISVWVSIYTYFINGTGKIKLQLYTTVFAALISVPMAIFLASNMGLGAAGVVLGSCLAYLPIAVISPIQYKKIINKTDHGIWGK